MGRSPWFFLWSVVFISQASLAGAPLKILTFNFNAETRNHLLKVERLKRIEQYISDKGPDLITIQESWNYGFTPNVAIIIAKDLNLDLAYRIENGFNGILLSSTTILARKELGLRDVVIKKLPHSTRFAFGNGRTFLFGLGGSAYVVGGRISLPVSGERAYVWTAHVNALDGPNQRHDQVRAIFNIMNDAVKKDGGVWENATVFLTGDMNSRPDSAQVQFLKNQAHMHDAWEQCHPTKSGTTFSGDIFSHEFNPMTHGAHLIPSQYMVKDDARIDYIFYHSPQAVRAGVTRIFTTPIDHIWMSDHYGLLATLEVGAAGLIPSPERDSDPALDGKPTVNLFGEEEFLEFPRHAVIHVNSQRGWAIRNDAGYALTVQFTGATDDIFTRPSATLENGEAVSFVFRKSGRYPFYLVFRDFRSAENPALRSSGRLRQRTLWGEAIVDLPY